PALALGVDPADPDIMKRKPRDPKKNIFAGGLWHMIILQGIIIGGLTLIAFNMGNQINEITGRTMAFITLSLSQIIHTFNVRSLDKSIFKLGLFSNKYLIIANVVSIFSMVIVILIPVLRNIFKLTFLNGQQVMTTIGLSILPLVIVEIVKLIKRISTNN
ncbi:cation transporting ATPase C-terminal domain-containing protein, partial [Gottschalkia purinilytica]|uniref:cation transporting ATPase C-terminal domain-containing protein n=1 Tax=Gottschalkia purinilytica TaxID=1503 RepID=UPI001910C68A